MSRSLFVLFLTASSPVLAGVAISTTLGVSSPAVPGEPLALSLSYPGNSTRVVLVRGAAGTSCPAALGGECLAVRDPVVVGDYNAAGLPGGSVTLVVPASAPVGGAAVFQLVAFTSSPAAPVELSAAVQVVLRDDVAAFGVWDDAFGGQWEIDNQVVRGAFGSWQISRFDASGVRVLARNDAANEYFPGLWSRFEFVAAGEAVWMCQSVYDGASEAAAASAPPADPSAPSVGGCGAFGFPWTMLTPGALDLAGAYVDEWGTPHLISESSWEQGGFGAWTISRFSNLDRAVIAQNAPDAAFAAGLWSRFDWAEVGGELYYCQTAYDAPSEYAARVTAAADATDPMSGGCGAFGFPWTRLD